MLNQNEISVGDFLATRSETIANCHEPKIKIYKIISENDEFWLLDNHISVQKKTLTQQGGFCAPNMDFTPTFFKPSEHEIDEFTNQNEAYLAYLMLRRFIHNGLHSEKNADIFYLHELKIIQEAAFLIDPNNTPRDSEKSIFNALHQELSHKAQLVMMHNIRKCYANPSHHLINEPEFLLFEKLEAIAPGVIHAQSIHLPADLKAKFIAYNEQKMTECSTGDYKFRPLAHGAVFAPDDDQVQLWLRETSRHQLYEKLFSWTNNNYKSWSLESLQAVVGAIVAHREKN